MRDSMKMTVRYQFLYMLLTQAAASAVTIVFGFVAFWYFLNMHIVKEIISVVFMTVNFVMLYSTSKKMAVKDNKPYTPINPSKVKGVMFGALISTVTLALMLTFIFAWRNFSDETGIYGFLPILVNVLFFCWSFPYNGIMGLNNGHFMVYSGVIMLILPVAATYLGYIAGCKNIDISEKFEKFIYEKE